MKRKESRVLSLQFKSWELLWQVGEYLKQMSEDKDECKDVHGEKKLVSASHKHLRRESYHARKILELIDYSEADK